MVVFTCELSSPRNRCWTQSKKRGRCTLRENQNVPLLVPQRSAVPFPCRYLFLVYTAWYGLLVHDRCAFGQPPCWLTHPAKSRFRRRLPELLPCRCTPGILREQAARQIIRVKRIIRRESKAISSICVWLILHCSTELDLWI